MQIAKPALDVGLYTNNRDAMLQFWQHRVGLPFTETLPVGGGVHQLRHAIGDSVLKINHARATLPEVAPTGYRLLTIARPDLQSVSSATDPDGNLINLVPQGHTGIDQLEVRVAVRSVSTQEDFYGRIMGLPRCDDGRFRCGASLIAIDHDPNAAADAEMRGIGYRYLTIQVYDVVAEHRAILARGGREGTAPVRLGDVAYISFVRDPDGNWIEISQRKSITGSLD
jgi:catechol 2,3-dioxygenase-like lactoylglutathione lyase family enzyme